MLPRLLCVAEWKLHPRHVERHHNSEGKVHKIQEPLSS